MMLSEAVAMFLDWQQNRKSRAESTIITYRSMLGFFLKFTGDIMVSEIDIHIIDSYALSLPIGMKPKSIKGRLTAVRSLISFLYSRNYINLRPEAIDIPKVESEEANFLDYDEQRSLIKACKDARELAIIQVLIRSGLRISELINLKNGDIFERSVLVRKGKGDKPRVSFLTAEAERALKKYKNNSDNEDEFLFINQYNNQISRQYIHRIIVTIAKRAGINKKVSPHTLRHTFATNMLRAGARVEDVQKMLGHSRAETTLIYMHFTNDYLHSRYDKFAEVECNYVERRKALST